MRVDQKKSHKLVALSGLEDFFVAASIQKEKEKTLKKEENDLNILLPKTTIGLKFSTIPLKKTLDQGILESSKQEPY